MKTGGKWESEVLMTAGTSGLKFGSARSPPLAPIVDSPSGTNGAPAPSLTGTAAPNDPEKKQTHDAAKSQSLGFGNE